MYVKTDGISYKTYVRKMFKTYPAPMGGYFSRQQNTRTERYRTRWPVAYDDVNARGMMPDRRRERSSDGGHRAKTKKHRLGVGRASRERKDHTRSTCTRRGWGWYRKGCRREPPGIDERTTDDE